MKFGDLLNQMRIRTFKPYSIETSKVRHVKIEFTRSSLKDVSTLLRGLKIDETHLS